MTPLERKQYLDDQIILTLQNDREWREKAVLNGIDKGDFEAFRSATCDNIMRISKLNTSGEYAYIYCTLWKSSTGTLKGIPVDWQKDNSEFLSKCNIETTTTTKQEKQTMTQATNVPIPGYEIKTPIDTTKAVQSITFIYGVNIADCSDDKFIETIRKLEGNIASLKSIQTQSKKILDKIKAMEDDLQSLVQTFDSK